ncbi:hypothetical protein ACX3PU_06165 [Chryseobacterium sp. A301]
MNKILKIVLGGALAVSVASCGAMDPYYGGNRYPSGTYGNGGVYRTPEGTVYRQGDVYRDRNGNIYRDGRVIERGNVYGRPGIIRRAQSYNARRLPPGQAKKIYGGNAKDYAPGQVKKRQSVYYGQKKNSYKKGNYKKNNSYYKKSNDKRKNKNNQH